MEIRKFTRDNTVLGSSQIPSKTLPKLSVSDEQFFPLLSPSTLEILYIAPKCTYHKLAYVVIGMYEKNASRGSENIRSLKNSVNSSGVTRWIAVNYYSSRLFNRYLL